MVKLIVFDIFNLVYVNRENGAYTKTPPPSECKS